MEGHGATVQAIRMWDILSWLLFLVFIVGLLVIGGLLLRGYLTTGSPASALTGGFFGAKPEKRLEVVDQATVDGRRRLVLIRRDEIEHLIMTGGPVDVVIETGIGQPVAAKPEPLTPAAKEAPRSLVSRTKPSFDQAVGE
ncbi:MAG: flagellar biosynthetic protein FliO [Hyphomicrobiaceae bacterium]